MPNSASELESSLTNQSVSDEVGEQIEEVRLYAKEYGRALMEMVPDSREKSLAVTNLEQSVMWAVKAFVLN